jgi:hypothetical protein
MVCYILKIVPHLSSCFLITLYLQRRQGLERCKSNKVEDTNFKNTIYIVHIRFFYFIGMLTVSLESKV